MIARYIFIMEPREIRELKQQKCSLLSDQSDYSVHHVRVQTRLVHFYVICPLVFVFPICINLYSTLCFACA